MGTHLRFDPGKPAPRRGNLIDRSVARFLESRDWTGTPEDLMTGLCDDLLRETECRIPVDVRRLASFRGARVEEADQVVAGWIGMVAGRLVIRVRAGDVEARRRFTVCHEVCHTFFPDFAESPMQRSEPDVERYDERDQVEYLCDLGAAALLLPTAAFCILLPDRFTIDNLIGLARHFRASIEAVARRAVALSNSPVVLAILDRADGGLRVRWSAGKEILPACRSTAVLDSSPVVRALTQRTTVFRGETELLLGKYEYAVRHIPYPRDGQLVERTIVLARR